MISIIRPGVFSGGEFPDNDKSIPLGGKIVRIIRIKSIPIKSDEEEVKNMTNEENLDHIPDENEFDDELSKISDDELDRIPDEDHELDELPDFDVDELDDEDFNDEMNDDDMDDDL